MADLYVPVDHERGGVAAQVASGLREAVRSGRLAPGDRLPSSRDLATDLGVSRGVVVEAYEQLVAEGFLVSRVGSGTRVAPAAAACQRGPGGEEQVPYHDHRSRATSPDLGHFPRERWLAALRQALATIPSDALDYGDPGGIPELREELAGYLRRVRAADVEPENLVIVGGVAQGLSLVLHVLAAQAPRTPQGDGFGLAVEDPTSHRQIPLLRRAGAELLPVPVDGQGVDVAALREIGRAHV